MNKLREIWSPALPPLPEAALARIAAQTHGALCAAAQCFWLFRRLHRCETAAAALAGDYCFARFSAHLAALDSVALTDAFADFLRADTLREQTLEDYLDFLRRAGGLNG